MVTKCHVDKSPVIISTNKTFKNSQSYLLEMINNVMQDMNVAVPW